MLFSYSIQGFHFVSSFLFLQKYSVFCYPKDTPAIGYFTKKRALLCPWFWLLKGMVATLVRERLNYNANLDHSDIIILLTELARRPLRITTIPSAAVPLITSQWVTLLKSPTTSYHTEVMLPKHETITFKSQCALIPSRFLEQCFKTRN